MSYDYNDCEPMRFQSLVTRWVFACFGQKAYDKKERSYRFLEEAVELCQTMPGVSAEDAHKIVDHVYSRPIGEVKQEIGGVMVTLAALCEAVAADMVTCGDVEIQRCFTNIEKIRAKAAAKNNDGPLPGAHGNEVSTNAGRSSETQSDPLPAACQSEDGRDQVRDAGRGGADAKTETGS